MCTVLYYTDHPRSTIKLKLTSTIKSNNQEQSTNQNQTIKKSMNQMKTAHHAEQFDHITEQNTNRVPHKEYIPPCTGVKVSRVPRESWGNQAITFSYDSINLRLANIAGDIVNE